VRPAQELVAGIAVAEGVPSPADMETAACAHEVDVSITVKVTESGAGPEAGTTERVAIAGPLVPTVAVPPPIGLRFILGFVVDVVGMYTPQGFVVGTVEINLVPVHVACPYGLVDV